MAFPISGVLNTGNFPGTFFVDTNGFVQGAMEDDPVARFALRTGVASSAITVPIWGGVAIAESLAGGSSGVVEQAESVLLPATSGNGITGFTVYNQASAMVITNASNAPSAMPSMAVNFFRFGSGARVAVQTTSTVAAALAGGTISPTLYWDPVNYQVTTTSTSNVALPAGVKLTHVNQGNSRVVTFSSPNVTWTDGGSAIVLQL